jgi:cytochrome d ubiquinol oxidase subunit II
MAALWYVLIALMLTAWVVLDGFDLGAGIAHLMVARSDGERRSVLAAIGPVWDGNEVWLVAAGGVLVFAFPQAYAVAFSGFYLPLMLVLWLIIGRGLSIELRAQVPHPLWRSFWDAAFAFSSTVLALVMGVALGNVVRGVPLDGRGSFSAPLFTDLHVRGGTGVIDWYTLLVGVLVLVSLLGHGALYLAWKTSGPVRDRSLRLAAIALPLTGALALAVTLATALAQPALLGTFARRPAAWPLPLVAAGALAFAWRAARRGRERAAFLGSCAYLTALLVATAASLFPILLRSTVDPRFDVTAWGAASGRHGLVMGLVWWIPALVIAVGYFVYLFRSFAGKVRVDGY